MMWLIILGLVLAAVVAGLVYISKCFRRFGIIRRIAGDRKWLRRLLAVLPLLVFFICAVFDTVNSIIVLLHLIMFSLVADGLYALWRAFVRHIRRNVREQRPGRPEADAECADAEDALARSDATRDAEDEKQRSGKMAQEEYRPYWRGIFVICFTAIYLSVCWYLAHHVWITRYDLTTEKSLGQESLKVVLIADSHTGATFDGDGFAKEMERVQKENPDIVLIAGDFVDDGTSRKDMIRCCRALGELKTTYGIYYSFGNHDKGYFRGRSFSYEEMTAELRANDVTVLEDEAVLVNDSFYIIGRKDRSEESRMDMQELVKDLDREKYMIVIDHQPNDYKAEAEAGVDLVVSGHTHGGQLIPITFIGEWIGVNDSTYGYKKKEATDFVVTSGISDWAIRFKSGTKSEFVVMQIRAD